MKTFGLMSGNFQQYDWNSISEFSEKITTSREGIAKFSEISYREFLFHFIFLSECPEFSVEWLEVWKFNDFEIFQKVSRKIFDPCNTWKPTIRLKMDFYCLKSLPENNEKKHESCKVQGSCVRQITLCFSLLFAPLAMAEQTLYLLRLHEFLWTWYKAEETQPREKGDTYYYRCKFVSNFQSVFHILAFLARELPGFENRSQSVYCFGCKVNVSFKQLPKKKSHELWNESSIKKALTSETSYKRQVLVPVGRF